MKLEKLDKSQSRVCTNQIKAIEVVSLTSQHFLKHFTRTMILNDLPVLGLDALKFSVSRVSGASKLPVQKYCPPPTQDSVTRINGTIFLT